MKDFPNSFIVVIAFVVLALLLIAYFILKRFLFKYHKRKGDDALQRRDFVNAVKSFERAEALWDFNVTKQTTLSYQHDLATLDQLLSGLETAARARGITLPITEYRNALKAVQGGFKDCGAGDHATSREAYASAFIRLKNAQAVLRLQLRAKL